MNTLKIIACLAFIWLGSLGGLNFYKEGQFHERTQALQESHNQLLADFMACGSYGAGSTTDRLREGIY